MKTITNGLKTTHRSFFALALTGLLFFTTVQNVSAQSSYSTGTHEYYGNTYNLGLGPGYFGAYLMRSPYLTFNYEIELLPEFTLAPFVGFSTYRSNPQIYGNSSYRYRGTIMPIGAKASYYFDDLIELPWRWDLYAAGSLGYTFIRKSWPSEYRGPEGDIPGIRPLFLDVHVGAEYHLNSRTGLFVDLSTGVSVIGVALHR